MATETKTSLVEQAQRVLHADALVPDEEPRRLPMWLRDLVERRLAAAEHDEDGKGEAQQELEKSLSRVRHYLCAALPDGEGDAALADYGF